jgi:uncharacterized protein with ParB-like and HNH nuclease domain
MKVRLFLSSYNNNELNLKPFFQRNYVWSPAARSLLMDTVIRDYPMPLILLRDKPTGVENYQEVVDGQQRLTTLLAFIAPEKFPEANFSLTTSHSKAHGGSNFADLPEEVQDRILDYQITVYTLPKSTGDDVILNIFSRLNSTGMKLNEQEIRNANFSGPFKQFVYRVAQSHYATWLDWQVLKSSDLLRMSDALFVSDLTGFMLNGIHAQNKPTIDKLYRDYDQNFPLEETAEERINTTLQHLNRVYSGIPKKSYLRQKTWFYALFCLAYDYMYSNCRLQMNNGFNPLPKGWVELDERLTLAYEDQEQREKFSAVRTTNLDSRRKRHEALGKLLYGDGWTSPYS